MPVVIAVRCGGGALQTSVRHWRTSVSPAECWTGAIRNGAWSSH